MNKTLHLVCLVEEVEYSNNVPIVSSEMSVITVRHQNQLTPIVLFIYIYSYVSFIVLLACKICMLLLLLQTKLPFRDIKDFQIQIQIQVMKAAFNELLRN